MKARYLILGFICFFQAVVCLSAQDQTNLTPDQAWQRLKDGNARFASDQLKNPDIGNKKRQELAAGQHPFAIVLSCADSRVPPEYIFNQGLGDIFVLRVAGNISEPYLVASMEFGVEQFHVPLIVVLGHDECGAVKAAMGKDRPGGDLGKLIDEVQPGKQLPADKSLALAEGIKNNARYQGDVLAKRSEVIRKHIAEKKVKIVSGVYKFSTGKVEWLDQK
jgi:carbonic anhydrase